MGYDWGNVQSMFQAHEAMVLRKIRFLGANWNGLQPSPGNCPCLECDSLSLILLWASQFLQFMWEIRRYPQCYPWWLTPKSDWKSCPKMILRLFLMFLELNTSGLGSRPISKSYPCISYPYQCFPNLGQLKTCQQMVSHSNWHQRFFSRRGLGAEIWQPWKGTKPGLSWGWGFPNHGGTPINWWFILENLVKWMI